MVCWRVKMDVCDHDLNAALAASTAACISSCVAFGTRVITSFVACHTAITISKSANPKKKTKKKPKSHRIVQVDPIVGLRLDHLAVDEQFCGVHISHAMRIRQLLQAQS